MAQYPWANYLIGLVNYKGPHIYVDANTLKYMITWIKKINPRARYQINYTAQININCVHTCMDNIYLLLVS